MVRETGEVAAALGRRVFLPTLILLLASMDEGMTMDTSRSQPMILEAPRDSALLQPQLHAHHDHGRESPSSYSGNKDDFANILMFPTATKSMMGVTCTYKVTIKTSCTSPKITKDAISISFGDGNGNQVYAARLDDPSTGTFEQCSTDTFQIQGPCGNRTCYLYLRRSGDDGWAPEWVKIAPFSSDDEAVTFNYNASPLPADAWYGFNLCPGDSGDGGSRKAGLGVAGPALWTGVVVLFLLLQPAFMRI